jgi:hypothetical protein
MEHYISYIKDAVGNNYIGIKMYLHTVDPFLNRLKEILSEEDYKIYTQNQQNRDHGSHHITIINVMDYNRLSKEQGISNFVNSLEKVFEYPIDDIQFLGVGTASKNENRTYFVVCKSDKLDAIRNRFNLPQHDFHITLGFKWKDVFGVRKNEVLQTNSKFIQLLKQEFYKKENFNFIKTLENYDLPQDLEIIPLLINESYLKVLCGDYLMDVGCLDSGQFYIFTKYKKTNEYTNRLPLTEIYRILNKK